MPNRVKPYEGGIYACNCPNPLLLRQSDLRGKTIVFCGTCGHEARFRTIDNWVETYGTLSNIPTYQDVVQQEKAAEREKSQE